jgi:hypothetical protein
MLYSEVNDLRANVNSYKLEQWQKKTARPKFCEQANHHKSRNSKGKPTAMTFKRSKRTTKKSCASWD